MNLRLRHVVFAALLHLSLLALLLTGAQCSTHVEAPGSIQGVLISSDQLAAASKHALPPPPQPVPPKTEDVEGQARRQAAERQLEEERVKQQAQEAEQQRQQQAQAEQQKQAEEKRIADQKQAELQLRQAAEKDALQKAAEQKKQAEAEQKKQADAKKAADAAAEQKRQDDIQKQIQAEETKRLADLEKKKKDEAAKRAASDRMAKDDIAAQLGAEEKARMGSAWAAQVGEFVRRRHNPPNLPTGCTTVRIVMSRTGQVQSATVVQSTSNSQYDDSVVQAAYAASPLPLPADMSVFDAVRVSLPTELCPHS